MTEIPQLAGLPRRIFRSMRPVAPGAVFPGPHPLIDRMFAAKDAANYSFRVNPLGLPWPPAKPPDAGGAEMPLAKPSFLSTRVPFDNLPA
jgi:hypothetical protein